MSLSRSGKCLSILLARWRWIAEPWKKNDNVENTFYRELQASEEELQCWQYICQRASNLGGSRRGRLSLQRSRGSQSAQRNCVKGAKVLSNHSDPSGKEIIKISNHWHPSSAACRGVDGSLVNGLQSVARVVLTHHICNKRKYVDVFIFVTPLLLLRSNLGLVIKTE